MLGCPPASTIGLLTTKPSSATATGGPRDPAHRCREARRVGGRPPACAVRRGTPGPTRPRGHGPIWREERDRGAAKQCEEAQTISRGRWSRGRQRALEGASHAVVAIRSHPPTCLSGEAQMAALAAGRCPFRRLLVRRAKPLLRRGTPSLSLCAVLQVLMRNSSGGRAVQYAPHLCPPDDSTGSIWRGAYWTADVLDVGAGTPALARRMVCRCRYPHGIARQVEEEPQL